MDTVFPAGSSVQPQVRREVCDKCGAVMSLQSSGYGFERWACPSCRQVVGVDRDPLVGGRFQIDRGLPWRYSQEAFTR